MLNVQNILPVLVGLPFFGALTLSIGHWSKDVARWFTLVVKVVVLWISIETCSLFDTALGADWFQGLVSYQLWQNWNVILGVDGMSLSLVVLTAFIMPLSLLVAWTSISNNYRAFGICLLVLEGFLVLSFTSLDLLVFYIAF
jgi:NADH-quinone oxidoreductase subunit M